jgi:hypothetical protein
MSSVGTRGAGKKEKAPASAGKSSADAKPHSSTFIVRDTSKGMIPKPIISGLYGPRGERLRHQVHDGALHMPQESIDLIRNVAAQTEISVPEKFALPGLDTVIRPSVDPALEKITVTDVTLEQTQVLQQAEQPARMDPVTMQLKPAVPAVYQTQVVSTAVNRVIDRSVKSDSPSTAGADPERIRGGGGEDDAMDAVETPDQAQAQAPAPPAEASAAQTAPAAPEVATSEPAPAPVPSTEASDPAKSSEETKPSTAATTEESSLKSLAKTPPAQWEQHKPAANDETLSSPDQLTKKPAWYSKDKISDIERNMLPEWFDASAPHRTPEAYVAARDKVIHMADQLSNRNVTNSMIRRTIVGDAGSLHRMHAFLVNWGFINEDAINDSCPTPMSLRGGLPGKKRFNEELQSELVQAVVEQSKRRKTEQDNAMTDSDDKPVSSLVPIDWEEIASKIGHGISPKDCEQEFLNLPLEDEVQQSSSSTERPITPDPSHQDSSVKAEARDTASLKKIIFQELVEESSPEVLSKVTEAAIAATNGDLIKAQKAGLVGVVASKAVEKARSKEEAVSSLLNELVSQRMQKLENRLALMDDLEGMLEAERVALELERRDLYTARCRHWFMGP